jgi:NAD(P)-dependent dehydrogenase (short-subunit alcohol dehydrogenase family)
MKHLLVTGAEGALGSQVVKTCLEKTDFEILATYHRSPGPSAARVQWIQVNLSQKETTETSLKNFEIDSVIHCAGGFRFATIDELQSSDLDFLLDANLRSSFNLVQTVLPGMKKRNFGRIALVSARASLQAGQGMAAYAASKSAINALTTAVADEVRAFNININSVLPTIIDTPANRKDMPKADFSQWVSTEALAEVLVWLVQPASSPINGALIPVAGRL